MSPRSTHPSFVIDWLDELVQLHTDVRTSYSHQSVVRSSSPGLTSSELGMYISQHYARTLISPTEKAPKDFSCHRGDYTICFTSKVLNLLARPQ